MNRKRSLRVALLLTFIAVSTYIGYNFYHLKTQENTTNQLEVVETIKAGNKNDIQFLGDKKQFVLTKNLINLRNGYLFGVTYNKVRYKETNRIDNEYISFVYFDIEHDLESKTVNIDKKVKSIHKNAAVIEINHQRLKNTITIYYRYSIDGKHSKTDVLYYNLDKDSYYTPSNSDKVTNADLSYAMFSLSYTNLTDIIPNFGLYYDAENRSIQSGQLKHKKIDININLFNDYPQLKSKLNQQEYTLYFLGKQTTNEEIFNTLLYWFAPKGERALSGVKINPEYSIDGQEHEIHSYEEFKQYYNGKGGELSE